MNYIDIILITIFIILCAATIYTLYKRIEGFAEEDSSSEISNFIKIVRRLSEQAAKVTDAFEKTQQSISNNTESTEKITITTKARDNNKLPIFDYTAFNTFIATNPSPQLDDIYPFIKSIEEYDNLLDTIYDIVTNEIQKMDNMLNKKESFISESFRTVCYDVPDDCLSQQNKLSQNEKETTLKNIKNITIHLESPENRKKMQIIDAAFNKIYEIKNTAEKGTTEDVINQYVPSAIPSN